MRFVLVALVFTAVGAGGAVGLMAWEPWDGDDEGGGSSAQYQRRLTQEEAAQVLEILVSEQVASTPTPGYVQRVGGCATLDFNEELRAWIVGCTIAIAAEDTPRLPFVEEAVSYRLYDETEKFEVVVPAGDPLQ